MIHKLILDTCSAWRNSAASVSVTPVPFDFSENGSAFLFGTMVSLSEETDNWESQYTEPIEFIMFCMTETEAQQPLISWRREKSAIDVQFRVCFGVRTGQDDKGAERASLISPCEMAMLAFLEWVAKNNVIDVYNKAARLVKHSPVTVLQNEFNANYDFAYSDITIQFPYAPPC